MDSRYSLDSMSRDVVKTLAYPVAGETVERPLLAGWILVLLGFLVPILPLIPFLGYLVRVLVSSGAGDTGSPPFMGDGPDTIRLGVSAAAISVVYLAIPVGLLVVTVYGLIESPRVPRDFAGTLIFFSGTTVVLILSLLASYLLPVALTAYGRERRLGAAFDYRTVGHLARSIDVFVGWAIAVAIAAVGAEVGLALLDLSALGPVLAALVFAYTAILTFHCLGGRIARAEQ